MAMKRPPQHRADAKIVYVHPADESWDEERILREQEEMREREEKPGDHPVARYLGGWTRYDLDAVATLNGETVSARQYLDPSKPATEWHLRRLRVDERYEIDSLLEQDIRAGSMKPRKAYLRACVLGLKKVENGPELEGAGRRLTANDLEKLQDLHPDLPLDIGEAVYTASLPLRDDEKKA